MSLFRRTETRSWDTLRQFGTGGPGFGQPQTDALSLVPLYAATSLIADSLAIMPITGYEVTGGARRRLSPQPDLLLTPHVNPGFTRIEWIHQFATSFLLRGNSYGLITKIDSAGTPSKVAWLHPDMVQIDETKGDPQYSYNGKPLDPMTVIHIPWYPKLGSVVGLSPVGAFKAQIETGHAATNYGRNWFKNGSVPSGHLKYGLGKLAPDQSAYVKARFKAAVADNDIFVSGNDWSWENLSISPDEAQFLQTIKANANQFAAIYRVNPEDIGGEPATSLTYSTVELNQIKFQTRALQPIFTRLETHISSRMPNFQYAKFNPDAIVRVDLKTRMEAHEIALRTGIETLDEGRELEEKAPLTPAQVAAWKEMYAKQPAPVAAPAAPAVPNKGGA